MIDKDCTTVFPAASVAVYSIIVSPMSNSAPGDIVDVTVGVTPELSVAIGSVQDTSTGASSVEGTYFVMGLGKEENVGASASVKTVVILMVAFYSLETSIICFATALICFSDKRMIWFSSLSCYTYHLNSVKNAK